MVAEARTLVVHYAYCMACGWRSTNTYDPTQARDFAMAHDRDHVAVHQAQLDRVVDLGWEPPSWFASMTAAPVKATGEQS